MPSRYAFCYPACFSSGNFLHNKSPLGGVLGNQDRESFTRKHRFVCRTIPQVWWRQKDCTKGTQAGRGMLQKSGPVWNAICMDSKVSFCLLFIYNFFIADYTINLKVIFKRVFENSEPHPMFGRGRHLWVKKLTVVLLAWLGPVQPALLLRK